jgi:hypothetical protein
VNHDAERPAPTAVGSGNLLGHWSIIYNDHHDWPNVANLLNFRSSAGQRNGHSAHVKIHVPNSSPTNMEFPNTELWVKIKHLKQSDDDATERDRNPKAE